MKNYSRLNRYCLFMAWLTWIPLLCAIVACFSPVLFYFFNTHNIGLESGNYSLFVTTIVDVNPTNLNILQSILATILDTLPILMLVFAFYQLRLLFISYSQSHYFAVKSAKHCYYFGIGLVMWVILGLLFEPLLSLILTYIQPQGRYISVSLSSEDIITLFPALCIMIIGQILKKAAELAEENNQFV